MPDIVSIVKRFPIHDCAGDVDGGKCEEWKKEMRLQKSVKQQYKYEEATKKSKNTEPTQMN